eukprot:123839_1
MNTIMIYIIFIILLQYEMISGNQIIDCRDEEQCANDTIKLSVRGEIQAWGYKSNSGPLASIIISETCDRLPCDELPADIEAYGAFSCSDISSIQSAGHISCGGRNSCSHASIYTDRAIGCMAASSCKHSIIKANQRHYKIVCGADQSCSYATLTSPVIYLFGAYAFSYGVIDSKNVSDNRMRVYLEGYHSGFGATIICQDTDVCDIYCYGNACDMTRIKCLAHDNCNILTEHTDLYRINGVFYAQPDNAISPESNITDVTYNHLLSQRNFSFLYNQLHWGNNDAACNDKATNSITFDDGYWQNLTDIISVDADIQDLICCRGYMSCYDISIVYNTSTSTSNIIECSGKYSCSRSFLTNSIGSIFCSGYGACKYAMINSKGNIYCTGAASCEMATIENANTVYCAGAYGSCTNTIINGVTNYYDLGGHNGNRHQIIRSNGRNMNVYLLSPQIYSSGKNMSITCNEGDNCLVECGTTTSCNNVTVQCFGVCTIQCMGLCPIVNTGTNGVTTTSTAQPSNTVKYTSSSRTSTEADRGCNLITILGRTSLMYAICISQVNGLALLG